MLQQTQVTTVIPYYEKFLKTLPTVHALARAPLSEVLRLWAGLGYYRRARHLKAAARQVVERHGGKMPQDYAQLRDLAGVGDYTAGALLSIAFGKPYPAVDGNARRVLSRLLRVTDERALRKIAAEIVPLGHPGDFNQAIMELGATICTARDPQCSDCTLNALCASQSRRGGVPVRRRARVSFKSVLWPLAIVRRDRKILLRRRNADGLLAGLWELPGKELRSGESVDNALRAQLTELKASLAAAKKVGEIRHAITHRRIRAPVYLFELDAGQAIKLPRAHWHWIAPAKVREHAASSMTRKAVALFSSHEKSFR